MSRPQAREYVDDLHDRIEGSAETDGSCRGLHARSPTGFTNRTLQEVAPLTCISISCLYLVQLSGWRKAAFWRALPHAREAKAGQDGNSLLDAVGADHPVNFVIELAANQRREGVAPRSDRVVLRDLIEASAHRG